MASCSKNFTSEAIFNLIIGEENKTKKISKSREKKQTELHPSQNMSEKNKIQRLYEKGKKFTSLQEVSYLIANPVTRNKFLQIKQCLKVADNRNLVEGSKIAKIKPLYYAFNMTLKQFGITKYQLTKRWYHTKDFIRLINS